MEEFNGMSGKRRFNFILPLDLMAQVEQVASEEETSAVDIVRRYIKMGLIHREKTVKADGKMYIEDDDGRSIVLWI